MTTESEIPIESPGFQQLADMLLSFKEQTNRQLEGMSTTMSEMQFQMQEQLKVVADDVTGMKTSLEGAWVEIEALKSASDQQNATIARLEKSVKSLQAELESEKQKRLHLGFYSCRENLRLVGIEEEGEEPEDVVREILQQMGVLRENLEFHAVHRVGEKRWLSKDGIQYNRQIMMRFINRQDRDRVWKNKVKILECEKYKHAFFVKDLLKEVAREKAILRKVVKKAKDNNIECHLRNHKVFLANTQMAYSLKELPEYLKL